MPGPEERGEEESPAGYVSIDLQAQSKDRCSSSI